MKGCFLLAIIIFLFGCQRPLEDQRPLYIGQSIDSSLSISTVAFGSCNDEQKAQIMWPAILQQQADLWIWMGDNIYGDTEDMQVMRRKYLKQKYQADYTRLRQQAIVIGTWDDHDYGAGDGGKEYPKKRASQALLLDFLDVPLRSTYRQQEGVYQSYTLGAAPAQLKIILLDCRYFRDELVPTESGVPRYYPNEEGDILGAAQWQWLEEELKNSMAAIHLLVSGIQIIPEEQPYESWANFPKARTRLLHLLDSLHPPGIILLSGDRHLAEISKYELASAPVPLYEITSSGLTHSYRGIPDESNRYRVGPIIGEKNFGVLNINWQAREVIAEVRNERNEILLAQKIDF